MTPSWTNEVYTEPSVVENTSSGQEVYSEAVYEENADWTPPMEADISVISQKSRIIFHIRNILFSY